MAVSFRLAGAPARVCARAPTRAAAAVAAPAAALQRAPQPLAAPRRLQRLRRARPLAATAKWVLIPIGTGDCAHLDAPVSLPSTIVLGDNKLVVGREVSPTVNLALPVPTVSGTHAMIDVVAGDYYVTDLASTNGTYVDGEELTAGTPCKLANGAEVIFGDEFLCKFVFEEIKDSELGL